MKPDKIDAEFRQLMAAMDAEQEANDLLLAVQMLIHGDKVPPGVERRQFISDALGLLIRSVPAAWESIGAANPDLTNDDQRQGAVQVALAMLLDLPPISRAVVRA